MVEEFSKELGRKIKGVKAIIGEAPDYVELAFLHFEATGEHLFGSKCKYGFARTKTPVGGATVAGVGGSLHGLDVDGWDRGDSIGDVWAVPLVVPASKR